MANRQRLMSNIPGVLDSTADTVGVLVLQLQGASAKEDLSDENETADRDTLPSREAADKAICDASEDLKGLLNLHEHHPDLHIADSVLCHGRLRNALLQLLVLTMRWELLRYRTAQPYTAALATEQRPIVSAAEEGDGTQRTALPLCGTAVSCRHVVLSIMSSMLKAGAEQLTRSNPNRSGTGSRGVRCLGRRRAGAASASNLEPGGLTASNGHPLSLLDLELGCTLLRTNTLQCCSVQLAAVCAWMGGDGEKQQQQQQQRQPFQVCPRGRPWLSRHCTAATSLHSAHLTRPFASVATALPPSDGLPACWPAYCLPGHTRAHTHTYTVCCRLDNSLTFG